MLDPTRFSLNEHANQDWTLTVEEGTNLEDVLAPAYFANVSSHLRPYDHIRVRVDTGEWYAELLVVSCGRVWAKTIALYSVDLVNKAQEEAEAESFDEYFVQYRGPHLRFCVIRKSDKEPVKERLETKAEALGWLSNYVLAL